VFDSIPLSRIELNLERMILVVRQIDFSLVLEALKSDIVSEIEVDLRQVGDLSGAIEFVLLHHVVVPSIFFKLVHLLMGQQIRTLCKSLEASWLLAYEWLFSCVSPDMRLQVEVERESFATGLALLWFFFGMN
jgi:hypothetical protein